MTRKVVSMRMSEDTIAYMEELARATGMPKTRVPEFAIELLRTYFTNTQLRTEALLYEPEDGRKKGEDF